MAWSLLLLSAAGLAQTTSFTPLDPAVDPATWLADADGDGASPSDGDCNDADPDVRPGAPERCGDHKDNDCDGLFDGGCDESARLASAQGGGCSGAAGATGAAVVLPLLGARRRGRR